MFKRIMVPLDGSRSSTRALRFATGLAQSYGAKVLLLRVVSSPTLTMPTGLPEVIVTPASAELAVQSARRQEKKDTTSANRYLQTRLRQLRAKGVTASKRVMVGPAGTSILGTARSEKVDLIVMTSRGRGGLRRAIRGSVTDEVMRHAGVPVLVIPLKK